MEGTSPGSPPIGGFRKTGNSEQYAFKKVNIEEYVKVIYMYQNLLPAGGATSITEHWHVDVFIQYFLKKHMKFGADWTLHV